MNFEDLKERFIEEFTQYKERIEDSDAYINLKERFDSLPPLYQKLSIAGIAGLLFFFIISFPLGFYNTSSEELAAFEEKRELTREMLKVQSEVNNLPSLPSTASLSSIEGRIQSSIQANKLLPEQNETVSIKRNVKSNAIDKDLLDGVVEVRLKKLNLIQIVKLGHDFELMGDTSYLKDIEITANKDLEGYFDAIYRVAAFSVPEKPKEPAPEIDTDKKKRGSSRTRRRRDRSKDRNSDEDEG